MLAYVPDRFKTLQEMCDDAIKRDECMLIHVPNRFKTREMCDDVIKHDIRMFKYVPDIISRRQRCVMMLSIKILCISRRYQILCITKNMLNDFEKLQDAYNTYKEKKPVEDLSLPNGWDKKNAFWDYKRIKELVDAYKIRKELRKELFLELEGVAWHPDRAYDWCFDEEHKGDIERLSKV